MQTKHLRLINDLNQSASLRDGTVDGEMRIHSPHLVQVALGKKIRKNGDCKNFQCYRTAKLAIVVDNIDHWPKINLLHAAMKRPCGSLKKTATQTKNL